MPRIQINLNDAVAYGELQRMAYELGYIQRGGPRSGDGSVVKMLQAVARGELIICPVDKVVDTERNNQPSNDD